MTSDGTLLVLHAHPDDEVFSTGGTLARYAREGHRVVVVYATRGEQGEMHHPDLDPDEALPRLGELREAEARQACDLLGVHEVYFLGYRDSGMAGTDANKRPEAFTNANFDEAVGRLLEIMKSTQASVLLTYDEESRYDHPDHVMSARVAVEAFARAQREDLPARKLYYSTNSREAFQGYARALREAGTPMPWLSDDVKIEDIDWGLPEDDITAFIDITPYVGLKKRALAVHRTQIKPDFFFLNIRDEDLKKHSNVEYFVRLYPPAEKGEREDDLFAGIQSAEDAA